MGRDENVVQGRTANDQESGVVREVHKILSCAFNLAVKWEYLAVNPASNASLPPVVFHSLRHTSTTVKLRLTGGDVKSVQGDTGHAQIKMVTDVYSHIWDEHRVRNAQLLENEFYSRLRSAEEREDGLEISSQPSESEKVLQLLKQSPELATQLLQLLSVQAQNQVQPPNLD